MGRAKALRKEREEPKTWTTSIVIDTGYGNNGTHIHFDGTGTGKWGESDLKILAKGICWTQPSGKAWIFVPWSAVKTFHTTSDIIRTRLEVHWRS